MEAAFRLIIIRQIYLSASNDIFEILASNYPTKRMDDGLFIIQSSDMPRIIHTKIIEQISSPNKPQIFVIGLQNFWGFLPDNIKNWLNEKRPNWLESSKNDNE
jgi:hypothetical protein